jgi:Holliday junction resolvase-like predicted endonuclease
MTNKSSMIRFMVYLNNQQFSSLDANFILKNARKSVGTYDIIVRDCRVSRFFIELDISISKEEKIENIIDLLKEISSLKEFVEVKERVYKKKEAIERSIQLFNEEKYWWSHEVLEGIWKIASGSEKELLNGLILVAAAFVHDQKNEKEISLSILQRALIKLFSSSGTYYAINVDIIKEKIKNIIENKQISRFTI